MRSAPLVGEAKGTRLKLCLAAEGAMISANHEVVGVPLVPWSRERQDPVSPDWQTDAVN